MPERTLYERVVAWAEAQPYAPDVRFPSGGRTWRGSLTVDLRVHPSGRRKVLRSRHATRTGAGRQHVTLTPPQVERMEVKVGARYRPIVDVLERMDK